MDERYKAVVQTDLVYDHLPTLSTPHHQHRRYYISQRRKGEEGKVFPSSPSSLASTSSLYLCSLGKLHHANMLLLRPRDYKKLLQ